MEKEVVVGDWAGGASRSPHDELYPARHPDGVDDEPELAHVRVDLQSVRVDGMDTRHAQEIVAVRISAEWRDGTNTGGREIL